MSADKSLMASKDSTVYSIRLFNHFNGLLELELTSVDTNLALQTELAVQLIELLNCASSHADIKVLLVNCSEQIQLVGDRNCINASVTAGLFKKLSDFPYPVVASFPSGARGAGFLFASLCDFLITRETGFFELTNPVTGILPSLPESELIGARFGKQNSRAFLYENYSANGVTLKNLGWGITISSAQSVASTNFPIVHKLLDKSQKSLSLLKRHLGGPVNRAAAELKEVKPEYLQNTKSNQLELKSIKTSFLKFRSHPDRCLELCISHKRKRYTMLNVLDDLGAAFKHIADLPEDDKPNSIIINSEFDTFLSVDEEPANRDTLHRMFSALNQITLPIVTVLSGKCDLLSLLLGASSDVVIHDENCRISVNWDYRSQSILQVLIELLQNRYGVQGCQKILFGGNTASLRSIAELSPSTLIFSEKLRIDKALEIISTWGQLTIPTLNSWTQNRRNLVAQALKHLEDEVFFDLTDVSASASENIYQSDVVSASIDTSGVVLLEMHDRNEKNMFSKAMVSSLETAFDYINAHENAKVVVLTGYDSYFCSGGNKDTLLAIQQGDVKFTDEKAFELPLYCKLPVVAAMQGHGIGAGWAMGLFSDVSYFSEESKYLSPYMNYGFTPGAGATLILPNKIARDIAWESLFSGIEFSGSELQKRNINHPVLPRNVVLDAARNNAETVAKLPRQILCFIKARLNQHLVERLGSFYEQELDMHAQTFVGQSDTLAKINGSFDSPQASVMGDADEHLVKPLSSSVLDLTEVSNTLRCMIAKELHLSAEEIDEHSEFIDLGLDSITGVTWMRQVNHEFGTSIEAIKVYSYPTLAKFAPFVSEQANAVLAENTVAQDKTVKSNEISRDTHVTLAKPKFGFSDTALAVDSLTTVKSDSNSKDGLVTKKTDVNNTDKLALRSLQDIEDKLRVLLAGELHLDDSEIDDNAQFVNLGLDSITGVTWVRKINEEFGTSIEAIKVYAFPTLAEFTGFIADELGASNLNSVEIHDTDDNATLRILPDSILMPEGAAQPIPGTADLTDSENPIQIGTRRKLVPLWNTGSKNTQQSQVSKKPTIEPIAVIGMAGQFPMAGNIDEYWHNIAIGRDCISEIPGNRWNNKAFYQGGKPAVGKTYCKYMGHLEQFDQFDPLFFNISPKEAISMDPQQRLLLQSCWQTFENAGYSPRAFGGKQCGVFIGGGKSDYHLLAKSLQTSALGFTGGDASILAARVSYLLDLQGPSLSIETACSSSLVAIALACDSLISGASEAALAGGVCVMAGPTMHIKTSQSGMLSESGKCFTFDQRANGFVPGEAVGAVLLKRLSDAENDNDRIIGVIRGWGVNQDGKTNGITAPNPESQMRLQMQVYEKFSIDPADIQVIEAHGTGTKLGDPIEVDALKQAFSKYTQNTNYCALGSVKSNIGHAMFAAGIASVQKVLLSLQNKKIPPTVNYSQLNEHIKLANSPFYVSDKLRPWEKHGSNRRCAAINGFGFGGTNAHLVIEEYQGQGTETTHYGFANRSAEKALIPLSAKSEQALFEQVAQLSRFLQNHEKVNEPINIASLAFTLQTGREAMPYRAAFIAKSSGELSVQLNDYLRSNSNPNVFIVLRDAENPSSVNRLVNMDKNRIIEARQQGNFDQIARAWVDGNIVDWSAFYPDGAPSKMALPTYPFAKENYWIENSGYIVDEPANSQNNVIHPLVHINQSNLRFQQYRSLFTGDEFYLNDHQVVFNDGARKVLPGVASLEMARAAINDAVSSFISHPFVVLHDVSWNEPVLVDAAKTLSIRLFSVDNQSGEEIIEFEIFSESDGESSALVYCSGRARVSSKQATSVPELVPEPITAPGGTSLVKDEIYQVFRKMGLHYGDSHQSLKKLSGSKNICIAELRLPDNITHSLGDFVLNPSLMDGAIQAALGLMLDNGVATNSPYLPFTLEDLRVYSDFSESMWAKVELSNRHKQANGILIIDITMLNSHMEVCTLLKGLALKKALQSRNTNADITSTVFDETHYENIIDSVVNNLISADEAVDLG